MRTLKYLILLLPLLTFTSKSAEQSSVLGVWKGHLGSLPAVTLTVERGEGTLIGAVLFYMIRRGPDGTQTASPGSPEPLLDPSFDGKVLTFEVSHKNAHPPRTLNDPPVQFQLELRGADKAILRGKDAPPLEMVRVRP